MGSENLDKHRLKDLEYLGMENEVFIVNEQLYPESRGWIKYTFRNKEDALEFIKTGNLSLAIG